MMSEQGAEAGASATLDGSETAIVLRQVSKQFPSKKGVFTAVKDLNLKVRSGEFLSVVGPSGCGKSTILSLVAGLEPPTTGEVLVEGRPVEGVQRNLGFLFQRDALLPWKNVLDNVRFAPQLRQWPKDTALELSRTWIRRVGLAGFEQNYPHQLSGGMRKRVALAQTLIYDPPTVLMDEPFSALDVQTRNLMENELLDLWSEFQKTVIFITHDLEEAIALSDRVVVMTAGPGRIKAEYSIDLPRPRNVTEIRFNPAFTELYEKIWRDLRDEVQISYEQQNRTH